MAPGKETTEEDRAGLCAACGHLMKIRSDRGPLYFHCRRSETDPRYPKYPPIPVLACPGFEPREG